MLRLFIFFISFAFSTTLSAQAYKDSITAQFMRYTSLLIKKDFAKSANYINPGCFKVISKPQLVAAMENTNNNPAYEISMENPVVVSVGDSKVIHGDHFVKMQYSNFQKLHFKSNDSKVQDTTAIKAALIKKFGQANVSYDAASGNYKIFVIQDVIANSTDKQNWTFVIIEEKLKPMLEKFIPKELL
jgi:hypothetical protein